MITFNTPKIVLTGGPHAGKSEILEYLGKELPNHDIVPTFVPESVTALFNAGFRYVDIRHDSEREWEYQIRLTRYQIQMEWLYWQFAMLYKPIHGKKVALICDRGTIDNCAYIDPSKWDQLAGSFMQSYWTMKKEYDQVIHLETSALIGIYDNNNAARHETMEQAIEMDKRTWDAWSAKPPYLHHERVSCRESFEEKCEEVLNHIVTKVNKLYETRTDI